MTPLALLNLGPWEIALIALLALLLFGGKRLPSLAKDLGSGIREFRKSFSEAAEEEPKKPAITQDEAIFPEVKEDKAKTKKRS
jgi:sec-independent protein translocase protein TatA